MLVQSVFLTTIINFITATDVPIAIPPPFNQIRAGFPRAQVGMFRPDPVMHSGPRLPQRLLPPRNKIWLKKFDPRSRSWIKVLKEKPKPIDFKLHHHFAKKAHFVRKAKLNRMVRLRKLTRMNIARKGHERRYKHYSKKPIGMVPIRPRIRPTGFLGQSIFGKPHSLPNVLNIGRRRIIRQKNKFNERFPHENEYLDDFKDDDRDFRGIHNSFDGRFNGGFRSTQPNLDAMNIGVGGSQFDASMKGFPQAANPVTRGDIADMQQKDFYHKQNNIPKYETETFGIGETQARVLNPANQIKENINVAVHGSFDRKNEDPFEGITDTRGASFNGLPGDDTARFTSIGTFGGAILGTQQTGFITNPGDLTDTMSQIPLSNDKILDTPIVPNPVNDFTFPRIGTPGITIDNRLPDGLLHDSHDVEDLDGIDDKDDRKTDHLDDLNDRLHIERSLDLDDRIDFDVRSHDNLDINDRHHNTFTHIPHIQNGVHNNFANIRTIAHASDKFDRDDKGSEHENGHHGHDDSPIDGLELLGSSRWSDIISELTNAASHNQIYDQIPRESSR